MDVAVFVCVCVVFKNIPIQELVLHDNVSTCLAGGPNWYLYQWGLGRVAAKWKRIDINTALLSSLPLRIYLKIRALEYRPSPRTPTPFKHNFFHFPSLVWEIPPICPSGEAPLKIYIQSHKTQKLMRIVFGWTLFLLAPTGALIVILVYFISIHGSSHFFRFSLSPSMQLMLQVSLQVA